MFGYIRPSKGMLRVCEYETYQAVYCGLCKQLGRQYGPFARMTLSFDFTFLTLLGMSLDEKDSSFAPGRCILNPLKKRPCLQSCSWLSFSSDVAMIMFYYKALDNYTDGGTGARFLTLLCMPFARAAYKKASDRTPDVASIIYETISKQSLVEDERCDSVDRAAEPSALALSQICGLLTHDGGKRRVLERFGYLLGRYVYLADALDDLEEDICHGSYNAFVLREHLDALDPQRLADVRENAKGSLFLTIGEIIKTYELLELGAYKPILDNVIYLGLRETVERILLPKENEHR